MKNFILTLFLLCVFSSIQAQESRIASDLIEEESPFFMVRGEVIDMETNKPISKVNIEVNGGSYTTTDAQGEFMIQVRLEDELVIKHSDFKTLYYTIKDNQRITVKVKPNEEEYYSFSRSRKQANAGISFKSLIDSSDTYLKVDAKKSLEFATQALELANTRNENAKTFELVGDINFYWQQYDLAINNYRISLQSEQKERVALKLAASYYKNKNYQESITAYKEINEQVLSNWQKVVLFEGLGEVYQATRAYDEAIENYKKGLNLAQKHLITPKITDLNSKIAEAYASSGATNEAEDYYQNSLNLAEQESPKRAVLEKVKVADFQNINRDYDAEIQLRQEALEDINEIAKDSFIDNESALTPQKQNYKIGNAYYLQQDFENAIPFLEKSIQEADKQNDLVVQKDASRKLSDVYRDAGDYSKSVEWYNAYIMVHDELYSKREQDITQAGRFRQDLSDKQSRINSLESDRALSATKYELSLEQNKSQRIIIYSLIGGLLLLLTAGYFMYKSIRQQKLANNLLALKSLRSQMNPHFIFNALNSVNSFIAESDERTANKYLTDFSLLMRAVLENSEEDFIPLEKELELLKRYTKLEHFRFQDKFDYNITVEPNVKIQEFKIPPMLLQPYIENAVWHGLRYKKEKGNLMIYLSQQSDDRLGITIADDGIGREKSKAMKTQNQKKHNSKGLSNIKERLRILNEMYQDKIDVVISDHQDSEDVGTKVVVTIKKD
ncbi:MAG: histidine kinase [bacterium]